MSAVDDEATSPVVHVYPAQLERYFAPLIEALPDHEIRMVDDLEAALPDIEFLVLSGRPALDWSPATKLRMIQVGGAGVDSLLPATGLRDDVIVTNASGSHEPEMPEFVIAMLFALAYRVPTYVDQQRARVWKPRLPRSLSGRHLCVAGLGAIGESIAQRALALGMTVSGIRRSGSPVAGIDPVVNMADRLEALSGADALVVVTPLTEETRGLIGAEELAALNDRALLVDVSRGGVCDIDAVVEALDSGQLAGAAMDVFEPEPLPEASPLWATDNLLLTPHTAGNSRDYVSRWGATLAHNLQALADGRPLVNVVDRELGY